MRRDRNPAPTWRRGVRATDGTRQGEILHVSAATANKPEGALIRWDGADQPDTIDTSKLRPR